MSDESDEPTRDHEGYPRLSDARLADLAARFDAASWNATDELPYRVTSPERAVVLMLAAGGGLLGGAVVLLAGLLLK